MKTDTPEGKISIRDAVERVYQMLTADRQILGDRLNPAYYAPTHYDDVNREAWRSYDQAQQRARDRLDEKISEGVLFPQIRDPKHGQVLQIDRDEWASMGDVERMLVFETGIATVEGQRRTVFFDEKKFENVLSEIAQSTTKVDAPHVTDKGGRPPEYRWDEIKAFVFERLAELGLPHRNNKLLPSKAQLIELIQQNFGNKYDLPISTIRYHLDQWLAEWRKLAKTGFR